METLNIDGIFCKQVFQNSKTEILTDEKPNYTRGSILRLGFDNETIKDYYLYIKDIRKTRLKNLSSKDINNLGFLYDKHLHRYIKNKYPNFNFETTIYKVEFVCFKEDEEEDLK